MTLENMVTYGIPALFTTGILAWYWRKSYYPFFKRVHEIEPREHVRTLLFFFVVVGHVSVVMLGALLAPITLFLAYFSSGSLRILALIGGLGMLGACIGGLRLIPSTMQEWLNLNIPKWLKNLPMDTPDSRH